MDYTDRHLILKKQFSLAGNESLLTGSDMQLINNIFHSPMQVDLSRPVLDDGYKIFYGTGMLSECNLHFKYPVFKPFSPSPSKGVIILLHGLNERSWDKYLAWAYSLAKNTGKSVLLFPIAFHMNRSPDEWHDPRFMAPYVTERLQIIPGVSDSTFANIALSERLTAQPQRLFLSGYQSANDLIQLTDDIRMGNHPLFEAGTHVDFFAYSIGVLLSQVLLIANPGGRFDQSKFFFFCGGSVFSGMQGVSKYILDSSAFDRISDFYCEHLEEEEKKGGLFSDLLNDTLLGKAFRSMTSLTRLKKSRGNIFKKFKDQISAITLKNDKVIPSQKVFETIKGCRVEEWNFNFDYTHELPFPILHHALRYLVDKAFDKLFMKATLFLT